MKIPATDSEDSARTPAVPAIEARFAQLLWDSPVATIVSDMDSGVIESVNDAFVRLLGYSREQLIGHRGLDLGIWVDPRQREHIVATAVSGKHRQEIELDVRTASGDILTVIATVTLSEVDGRRLIVGQLYDITERRQTELRLRLLDRIARIGYESRTFDEVLTASLTAIHDARPGLSVGFGQIVGDELVTIRSIVPETMPDLTGARFDLTIAPELTAMFKAGIPLAASDIAGDPRFAPIQAAMRMAQIAASLSVPVHRDNELVGALYFQAPIPTRWHDRDVELAADVAALLAVSLFRARAEEELLRERELMQTVMDYVPDFLYVKDVESRFTRVNKALATYCGLSDAREAIGKTDFDLFPRKLAERYFADEQRLIATGEPLFNLLEPLDVAETSWTLSTKVPIKDDTGKVLGLVGTCRDVTSVTSMEVVLRTSEQRQRALLEAIPDIVFRFDREGTFLDVRANRGTDLWVDPESRIGRRLNDVIPTLAAERITSSIQSALDTRKVVGVEYEMERNGVLHTFEMRIAPSSDTEVVAIARDVTERKSLEQRLAFQATHDPVTGLPNRTLFTERLNEALELARTGNAAVAVLFLDLNNFKAVNDTFGHAAGDRLLSAIADRLRRCVRAGDTVARIGGDEFAVLLERLPLGPEAKVIASRIADHVARPVRIGTHPAQTTASIGIAIGMPDQDTAESLLDQADRAMYEAKRKSKATNGATDYGKLLFVEGGGATNGRSPLDSDSDRRSDTARPKQVSTSAG